MKTFESGSKPRFDNKGSEFGNLHRELPKYCGMFDIDRMSANASISLELTKTETAFMEYRTDFYNSSIKFLAMFEIKHKMTDYVKEALECKMGTSTWAQMRMCQILGSRFFIVIGSNGQQPFEFYEVNVETGESELVYTLIYSTENKKDKINECWGQLGLLR